jgi:phospholipase C
MVDQAQPGLDRDRIKHIIVLMMENRSFDHLLGFLQHDNPRYPNLDRIEPKPSCPVDPARPDGRRVAVTPTASPILGTDPDHSHQAVMLQMFGRPGTPGQGTPTMSGFIASYQRKIRSGTLRPLAWWEKLVEPVLSRIKAFWNWLRRRPAPVLTKADEIMKCFPESAVPVLGFLAKQYAVLVNWHASVPGETWPNRQFAHAGTSHGTANIEIGYYTDETIFERLGDGRWGIYHDGVAQVWAYPKLWLGGVDHFHGMDRLLRDIADGTLPAYAFVEPNHGFGPGEGNSQHPGNNTVTGDSFRAGEALIAQIYNALVASPEVFAKTLFLVTYDEHGGFFDHVPPRPVVPPDGIVDQKTGFDFSHTGVRVPAVAISPLIPAGTVDETFYEHATIPATVRRQFLGESRPLSRREAAAEDLLVRLPLLPRPRTDLPAVRPPAAAAAAGATAAPEAPGARVLNDFQASLVELAGAVQVTRRQAARERVAAAAVAVPAFVPDPACHEAVQTGVLPAGSAAEQTIAEVVDDFTRDGPRPEPVDVEPGP